MGAGQYSASMGPRPFGRGRGGAVPAPDGASVLQWGRDLSAAEGRRRRRRRRRVASASMGPRPFGRGRLAPTGGRAWKCVCFNGAATFRPRKAIVEFYPMSLFASFNGAATFRPRKVGITKTIEQMTKGLQWGRDLSAAEGSPRPTEPPAPAPASMGPRPFGRGRPVHCPDWHWDRHASMGPRPFGRGRLAATQDGGSDYQLQWGRDLSAAEGSARGVPRPTACLLQWGRDLSAAEGGMHC